MEELGLDIDFNEICPMITINSQHAFDDIYVVEVEADIKASGGRGKACDVGNVKGKRFSHRE